MSSFPPRLRRHLRWIRKKKQIRTDAQEEPTEPLLIHSLFSRPGDVAEAVQGKVKLGAAPNDRRADLLEVAVPLELHPQDVRVCSPL